MMAKLCQKYAALVLGLAVCVPCFANTAPEDALLNTLKMQQPTYVMRDEDYQLDPRLIQKERKIDWLVQPEVDVNAAEFKHYKNAIQVEMTVIAQTGHIAAVKILKSTGSKAIDDKVLAALQKARFDSIRFVDANLTYTLVHRFEIEKPL